MTTRSLLGRAGLLAAAVAPVAAGLRFAHVYRERAGFPRRTPILHDPSALGLAFEPRILDASGTAIRAWWIPATGPAGGPLEGPAPAVVLVHGWESGRDRTLPNAGFLHAAGFHVLAIDVRGHGENPPESLPITAGEFAADALAAARSLFDRPEVSAVAVLGHSMGAAGALVAAGMEPRIAAVVATATPADPLRLTRQTFRIARLPIPAAVAWPLAWLTARVFVEPRGHRLEDVSATEGAIRYRGPLLLVHGDRDEVMPAEHLDRIAAAARTARAGDLTAARVETLVLPGAAHSWLYESSAYRSAIARFLARLPGSRLDPDAAAAAALAVDARRLPGTDHPPLIGADTAGAPDAAEAGVADFLDPAASLQAAVPTDAAG